MTVYHSFSSLEQMVRTLKTDSAMVLSRVSKGETDTQIVAWSGSWNYTLPMVQNALCEIYRVFGVDGVETESAKRERVGVMYRRYVDLLFANRSLPVQPDAPVRQNVRADPRRNVSEGGKEMERTIDKNDPRIEEIGQLHPIELQIAELLSRGSDNYRISLQLKHPVEQVEPAVNRLCEKLKTHTLGSPLKRRNAVGDLYLSYRERYPDRLETKQETSASADQSSTEHAEAIEQPSAEAASHERSDLERVARSLPAKLLPYELKILSHVVAGAGNDQIAQALGLSSNSVAPALTKMFQKLELSRLPVTQRRAALRAIGMCAAGETQRAEALLKTAGVASLTGVPPAGDDTAVSNAPDDSKAESAEPESDSTQISDEGASQEPETAAVASEPPSESGGAEERISQAVELLRSFDSSSTTLKTVACMVRGLNNQQIAEELNLSTQRISQVMSALYRKLGLEKSAGVTFRRNLICEAYVQLHTAHVDVPVESEEPTSTSAEADETAKQTDLPETQPAPEGKPEKSELPSVQSGREAPRQELQYGPGISIHLEDAGSIADLHVVSGPGFPAMFAERIYTGKKQGYRPETLVVYPTSDPTISVAHLVLVKRER